MLKTKEKTKPKPKQTHQKKSKNRPKCCTANMHKSFNVLVIANLPQSLFGSDPPLSSSSSSSSSSSGAVVPSTSETNLSRPTAGETQPWVSVIGRGSTSPPARPSSFLFFFGFHASRASLFYCFSTKGCFVFLLY
jgi:hypothetical protein